MIGYAVYELANETRREFFVGLADGDVDRRIARLRASPPRAIAHWSFEDRISARVVEESLPRADGETFLRSYVAALSRTSWRVLSADSSLMPAV